MQTLAITPEMFQGAVSVETGDGWVRPHRLPHTLAPVLNEDLMVRATMTAGVRLRLDTDSTTIALVTDGYEDKGSCDITIDNEIVASSPVVEGTKTVEFAPLKPGPKVLELWLPTHTAATLKHLLIDDGCYAKPSEDTRLRWVTYGSSITHCNAAHSAARSWPAVVARSADLHLTCLGFGGQCHLDPLVATTIRDLKADLISLKVGINIYGNSSLSRRSFAPNLMGFVQIIREKHPTTPIAVLSPIVSPPRETTENSVSLTLVQMREMVAEAVDKLTALGDRHILYANGLTLFDAPDIANLPDNLHPNGDGYELMGKRFYETVLPRMLSLRA